MMRMPNALLAAILAILASFGTADATTIYYDEVAFIADSGPLDLESFEGLAAGNESVAFSRTLPDFTISASSLAAVNDIATADGQHATDGTHYIIQTEAGTRMAFTVTFASPIR